MKTVYYIFLTLVVVLSSCSKTEDSLPDNTADGNNQNEGVDNSWLIPRKEVRDGGPGKDGIPAITSPVFAEVSSIKYLKDDDLVLGFIDGDDIRAYPHAVLDWHEIINDDTEYFSLAVIYCPLTGTGIGWERFVTRGKTTFGVSGFLYNSNIIPYDRETDSNWSQILLKSVNGKLKGQKAVTFNLFETSWKSWKKMFPNSRVVSEETGFNRNYSTSPYESYKESESVSFPVSNIDTRLAPKERVLAVIINEKAKAYQFEKINPVNILLEDEFQEKKLVIVKNRQANFMVAFERTLKDGDVLNFEPVYNELPVIMKDTEGTKWDVFGRGINGSRKGEQLKLVPQMMGYWFAFAAFYPNLGLK